MKRILAIFLAVALVFSISACGTDTSEKPSEGEKVSETEETSEISIDELLSDAPDTYDYALRVSINPEFILYLVEHRVVAYQALNADAQKVDERAAIEDRDLFEALNDIVRSSYEEGFLEDGGDVTVTMVSAFRTEAEANELLTEAKGKVTEIAKDCGISVNPVITVEENVEFSEELEIPEQTDSEAPSEQGDSDQENSPELGNNPEQGNNPGSEDNPPAPNEDNNNENPDDDHEYHAPRDPNEGCSVCHGSGICVRCGGRGTAICEECNSGYETCTKCGGEGYAGGDENGPKVCDQCGGNGHITHGNCGGTGIVPCQGCRGSGKCEACGGTGKKPNA